MSYEQCAILMSMSLILWMQIQINSLSRRLDLQRGVIRKLVEVVNGGPLRGS